MTPQIISAAAALGITVHDHLVIGKSDQISFRAQGLI
jgi:DNA repair protein RadC